MGDRKNDLAEWHTRNHPSLSDDNIPRRAGRKSAALTLCQRAASLSNPKRMCGARPQVVHAMSVPFSIFVFKKYNQAGSLWRPRMTAGRDLSLLAAGLVSLVVPKTSLLSFIPHSFGRHVFVHHSVLVGEDEDFLRLGLPNESTIKPL